MTFILYRIGLPPANTSARTRRRERETCRPVSRDAARACSTACTQPQTRPRKNAWLACGDAASRPNTASVDLQQGCALCQHQLWTANNKGPPDPPPTTPSIYLHRQHSNSSPINHRSPPPSHAGSLESLAPVPCERYPALAASAGQLPRTSRVLRTLQRSLQHWRAPCCPRT